MTTYLVIILSKNLILNERLEKIVDFDNLMKYDINCKENFNGAPC